MTEPRENEEARNVHESVPQTETSAPGDLQGDPRSIEEIKRNLFSATPSNEPNDNNLVVRTEYSQPNAPLEPAQQAACIDLNASGGSLGSSFHGSLSSSLTTEDMRRLYDRELHLDGCK